MGAHKREYCRAGLHKLEPPNITPDDIRRECIPCSKIRNAGKAARYHAKQRELRRRVQEFINRPLTKGFDGLLSVDFIRRWQEYLAMKDYKPDRNPR